jgi:hypothetical protein
MQNGKSMDLKEKLLVVEIARRATMGLGSKDTDYPRFPSSNSRPTLVCGSVEMIAG